MYSGITCSNRERSVRLLIYVHTHVCESPGMIWFNFTPIKYYYLIDFKI